MARVIIPIPSLDFDPTEVAIPWRALHHRGHEVSFATPDGRPGVADDIMLTGRGLDLWGFIPGLRNAPMVGALLRAAPAARVAYAEMIAAPAFRQPLRWDDVKADDFDGLLLPGGHRARGMQRYLESEMLQRVAVAFFRANQPVAAICHGVLVLARSVDPGTGKSVLFGRRTTALTWKLENSAASLAGVTRFWDPHYYRTYRDAKGQPNGYMSVQREVERALKSPADFEDVPAKAADRGRKTSGLARDAESDLRPSFLVRDGNYVSARWPGDAHAFALAFAAVLEGSPVPN